MPANGFLILPLSMSKLHTSQSPVEIYAFLGRFADKIRTISVDVILLYTNGLYFNAEQSAMSLRKKSTNQMVTHSRALAQPLFASRA